MSTENEETLDINGAANTEPSKEKRIGCAHYKRRAKFVTPCCNKVYVCRYCHDENEQHYFNRKSVTELICTECDKRQKVQEECENCGVRFGKYTCLICNLFDDDDKRQYHCEGCGICRVGGRDRFFHCERCNMCLPVQLQQVGHRLWSYLDSEVAATPMPPEYADYKATILCKDCHKLSTVKFHVVGLKCQHCGAYNTCQTNGFHKDSNSTQAGDSSTATSTSTSRSGSSSATFPETREETQNDELPRANPMDEPPQA
ncbi:hypothetical protein SFRURICE_009873 [Spodoptera frugiperda]|nr:hypothetical protein SFRURICE_009873 [Spodoptera frugiperda]